MLKTNSLRSPVVGWWRADVAKLDDGVYGSCTTEPRAGIGWPQNALRYH